MRDFVQAKAGEAGLAIITAFFTGKDSLAKLSSLALMAHEMQEVRWSNHLAWFQTPVNGLLSVKVNSFLLLELTLMFPASKNLRAFISRCVDLSVFFPE